MRILAALAFALIADSAASACPAMKTLPARLDEATVKAKSHAFFDALDKADATALSELLGTSFTVFTHERFIDKDLLGKLLQRRADSHGPARSRRWKDEHVFITDTSAIFIGESVEHVPSAGDAKPVDEDGWSTLVWSPECGTWKLEHFQWQKGGVDLERDQWNDTFRTGKGFNHKPNELLVNVVKSRKPGRALDLAMGQGRNAVYLATKGWHVTGVDIATEGLRIANEDAAKQKVKIETIEADIDAWDLGKEQWDLVAMIYAGADQKLVERAKASLKKGGLFVTEYFSSDSNGAKLGIGGWKNDELAAQFKEGFKILRDDVVEDVADYGMMKDRLVRFVAEKL
jgi:SAM-dependent methyltransferase